jgi:hypothetical protein
LLFIGPPASAKTLFLLGILECRKGIYFDGSNNTNRILDVLEENRSKIICIDELDKMLRQFQDKLLNFLESGHIKVDQMRKRYGFKIKGAKVFAGNYKTIKTLAIPVSTVTSAVIYRGAISRGIGQSIAQGENCSCHWKSSMGPQR